MYDELLLRGRELLAAAPAKGISARDFAYGIQDFPKNTEGRPSVNLALSALEHGVDTGLIQRAEAREAARQRHYRLA